MAIAKDITGQRFGKLVAVKRIGTYHTHAQWLCVCDCGKETLATSNNLKSGHKRSCGCLAHEILTNRNTKHGGCSERLYWVWHGMVGRCNDSGRWNYTYYGDRGIKVCDEWRSYRAFREWAISNGYDETAKYGECTLDRIDVDGDYEPSNCRWVPMSVQARNKRTA